MGLSNHLFLYVFSWSYFIFKQMNSDYKIKIGFSYHSQEPAKYKKDRELSEKFMKKWKRYEKPIIRNLLSKSPEFINNLLK